MIETRTARSGVRFLVVNGKQTASSIDPRKEASKWAQAHHQRVQTRDLIIVLGAGSGFHIEALEQQNSGKPIIVFETDPEILLHLQNLHTFTDQVQLILIENEAALESFDYKQVVGKKFVVLKYLPSLQMNPRLYARLHLCLTGRDRSIPAAYKALLPACSIYEIENALRSKAHLNESDRIWLMLKELVK